MSDSENVVTLDERYTSATATSDLRVEAERKGPADVLIAVGWSSSRIGAGLLRLHSEWDGVSQARPMSRDAMDRLAREMAGPDGKPDHKGARIAADRWRQHEAMLAMQRLKSLPSVREQVTQHAKTWGMPRPEHVAASVLMWWLDHTCKPCGGTKWITAEGTGRQTARACPACRGTGEERLPCGDDGKRMLNWLKDCIAQGRQSIKRRLRP